MNFFRKLFTTARAMRSNRMQRYIGSVMHTGVGYPTADEARRDMQQYDRHSHPFGWPM